MDREEGYSQAAVFHDPLTDRKAPREPHRKRRPDEIELNAAPVAWVMPNHPMKGVLHIGHSHCNTKARSSLEIVGNMDRETGQRLRAAEGHSRRGAEVCISAPSVPNQPQLNWLLLRQTYPGARGTNPFRWKNPTSLFMSCKDFSRMGFGSASRISMNSIASQHVRDTAMQEMISARMQQLCKGRRVCNRLGQADLAHMGKAGHSDP